ncbi:MAG: hypothetical protein ABJP45_01515 [Cyclobacteriaceae bacterium]
MSANPIIYCLENLTDYRQFERLCSDIMAGAGYESIEPIGGTGDGGRDALHYCSSQEITTIFAYTVRSDWQRKLKQDCTRISEEEHDLKHLVFVCTSTLNGNQRDASQSYVTKEYGWRLEIFDLERIRILLAGNLRHLIAQHPTIFCPPWFPAKGGLSISESLDTLLLDHTHHDHAIAIWLARKLSLAGFRTWCYGMAPLAGENINESIKTLIEKRALQYIPILSPESFTDLDFVGRIGNATRDGFILPCWAVSMNDLVSSSAILQIEPARFDASLKSGLESVLKGLKSRGIKPQLDSEHGNKIALQAYMPEPVTKAASEKIFSNVFSATVPKSILTYELSSEIDENQLEIARHSWAFSRVSKNKLLAFNEPSSHLSLDGTDLSSEFAWKDYEYREGKKTINVVKELIRRSLDVACFQAGLLLCENRNVLHFPEKDGDRHNISFVHVDGRKTHVTMTGIKQDGWGDRAIKFRYQLGPKFTIGQDEEEQFWITTRIYVRVTDLLGTPFEDKEIGKKRKKVTKSWWNKHWLARILGLMKGISSSSSEETIEIGDGKRKVIVSTIPLQWDCPVSIDVEAVDRIGDFQEEMAEVRFRGEELESAPETEKETNRDE